MNTIFYTWQDFDQDLSLLSSKISQDAWIPDFVVGIKRGGLVPAIKLSHILNRPLSIMSCQLRDNHHDVDVKFLELENIEDKKILIVDDICDTGETLSKISQQLKEKFKSIKFCTLFYNVKQDFIPDYRARKIDRDNDKRWIVFPWEVQI